MYSEKIDKLSPEAERFFYRLLVVVDDYGCYDARPSLLARKVFPLKENIDGRMADKWLSECVKQGLIETYEVDGKEYLEVLQFDQRIRLMRRKYPKNPKCPSLVSNPPSPVSNPPLESESESESESEKDKSKTAPSGSVKKHLFKNSLFSDFGKFRAALPIWDERKARHYFQAVSDWSASGGKMKIDWIATARTFERKDRQDGKAVGGLVIINRPPAISAPKPAPDMNPSKPIEDFDQQKFDEIVPDYIKKLTGKIAGKMDMNK